MRTALSEDGYGKMDARIQAIEDLAWDGVFSGKGAPERFQSIVSETRKLRQVLWGLFLIESKPAPCGPGNTGPDAA